MQQAAYKLVLGSTADVALVPPLANGKAPVTFDVRSIEPANIEFVIVDHAGSVPFVVRTVFAEPIASLSVAEAL